MVLQHLEQLPNVEINKKWACWIATAVYGDPFLPEIEILRDFREGIMYQTFYGKFLSNFYYKTSPPIAKVISKSKFLREFFKIFLIKPFVNFSTLILKNKQPFYLEHLFLIRKILREK